MLDPLSRLNTSDRALVRAARMVATPGDPWLRRLSPAWAARLTPALLSPADSTGDSRTALQRDHAASASIDPERVHPSWLARCLKHESPAVRAAVLSHLAPTVVEPVARELGMKPARSAKADPLTVRYAMALAFGALTAGPEPSQYDPPVIRALGGRPRSQLVHLLRILGELKLAVAKGVEPRPGPASRAPATIDRSGIDEQTQWARHDSEDARADETMSGLARLGLTTIARLLRRVETSRAAWAWQQLPASMFAFARETTAWKRPAAIDQLAWEAELLDEGLRQLDSAPQRNETGQA